MIKFLVGLAVGALAVLSYMVAAQNEFGVNTYAVEDFKLSRNTLQAPGLDNYFGHHDLTENGSYTTFTTGLQIYETNPFFELEPSDVKSVCTSFSLSANTETKTGYISAGFRLNLTDAAKAELGRDLRHRLNGATWSGPYGAKIGFVNFDLIELEPENLEDGLETAPYFYLNTRPFYYIIIKQMITDLYGEPDVCDSLSRRWKKEFERLVGIAN